MSKNKNRYGADGKLSRCYRKWGSMLQRCGNPKHRNYGYYGGRGIKVCERWLNYDNFYEDMGDPPKGHWLERIKNEVGYGPGNCRWATPKEQANNRRLRPQVEGSLRQKARAAGMNYMRVYQRVRMGWSVELALSVPVQRPGAMTEHSKRKYGLIQ